MTKKTEWIILGEDCFYSADTEKTGLNNNAIVCGGSGSGKTWSIAEPKLLETTESSIIVSVTKRRIVDMYRILFAERGYNVIDLDFSSPDKNDYAYDPLLFVRSEEDVAALARAIVMADPRKGQAREDPYWDEAAISLLSAEIAYVLDSRDAFKRTDATRPNFSDVLELHDDLKIGENMSYTRRSAEGMITTSLDDRFDALEQNRPGSCFAVRCWQTFRFLPLRTASCVYSSLNVVLDTLFTKSVRTMMRRSQVVNFEQLAQEKVVLFVTSSPVNPALHSLVNLFYSQAFRSLFEYAEKQPDRMLPVPVHVLCDDFATGGRILNFPEYISIFREKGIGATLLLQSESQLSKMYGVEDATTIINNCDSYIFLGGMDLKTAQNVSIRANLPLEDVLYMPVGEEIVFRRGEKPVKTQRYKIKEDERYQELAETYEAQNAIMGVQNR